MTKPWDCDDCDKKVEVDIMHEDVYCCDGHGGYCGCGGFHINPVLCEECKKDRDND